MKRFDFEQQFLDCWHLVDDVNTLYEAVMEKDLTKDEISNILLGLFSLYSIKFDKAFRTFEEMVVEDGKLIMELKNGKSSVPVSE